MLKMKTRYVYERGAALFTALIFLTVIMMLSLYAMRSSVLELRMAGNHQAGTRAFQQAQAIANAVSANTANLPSLAIINASNCLPSDPLSTTTACAEHDLVLAGGYQGNQPALFDGSLANGEILARATRLAPLERPAPRSIGTSAAAYAVASYQVDASYDLAETGLGRSRVREGVMILISK